jgi:hypothetical protein
MNEAALQQTYKDYAGQVECIGVNVTKQKEVDAMAARIHSSGKGS